MEGEVTNLRMARGTTAGTGTGGNRRAKGVVPSKYGGKRGDTCRTFLAGCENYRAMEPGAFDNDQQLIRWALQLCEDKARPWAVRQMERMDHETDTQNRPPRELRDWQRLLEIYVSIMTVCSKVVTLINERQGKSPYKCKKMKH
jgi:hypothetical protein